MEGYKFADDEEAVCMAICWLEEEIKKSHTMEFEH